MKTPFPEVRIRPVRDDDLDTFFAHQQEPGANTMAAFMRREPGDRQAFDDHWARIRANPEVTVRTVESGDEVVGHVATFRVDGELEVTYWIGKAFWGRGIATLALKELIALTPERPLHARAAHDNVASCRVLAKAGFVITGYDTEFAPARSEVVEQVVYRLNR